MRKTAKDVNSIKLKTERWAKANLWLAEGTELEIKLFSNTPQTVDWWLNGELRGREGGEVLQKVEMNVALTLRAAASRTVVFFVMHQPEKFIIKLKCR